MADRQVTMKDVAKRAGVSAGVVSAVLSGREHNIRMSEATRLRVEQAIVETGYRANHAAAALRRSRSGIIAAVVPKIANPVFELAIRGMHDAAEEAGDVLLLADAEWIEPDSRLMSRIAGTGMVDGFLVRSTHWGDETVDELTKRSIPFVVLRPPDVPGQVSVWVDEEAGLFTATTHLLKLGHRRIGMVGGPESSMTPRIDGYVAAMTAFEINIERNLVRPTGFDPIVIEREVRAMLSAADPPTAMILDNIVVAAGGLAAITDLGIRVPDDLSVVVYQDLPMADMMRPAPTTVRMPIYQAGARGYRTLRRMIDGKKARPALVASPRPKLVDRGSTRPV